jgi:serine protease
VKFGIRGLSILVGTTAVTLAASSLTALASAAPAANGTVNPYSPTAGHPYRHGAVPTLSQHAKMKSWDAAHPQAVTAATGPQTLSYGGGIDGIGVTSGHSKVYLIFYGTQWGTAGTSGGNTTFSNDAAGAAPAAQNMFKGVGTNSELWSAELTQWCDGPNVAAGATSCPANAAHIPYQSGGVLSGVWYDNAAASPTAATGHQLGVEAVKAASHFGNTTAASNRYAYYVVLSPKGTNPDQYQGQYCAWHDYNGDTTLTGGAVASTVGDVAFSNQPYNIDSGAGCGVGFVNSPGTLDGWTMTLGHEWQETMSDQNPAGGWTNHTGSSYNGQENSDECAWIAAGSAGGAANITFATGTFTEQASWSNDTNNCAITHPIVGGTANTVTVTNPGNKTGTVGTATSLQISATDSGAGTTLTYSATGLPTGLSINATSGLISGTPSAAGTFSVVAKATDNTGASGSASFSWTITAAGGCTAGQRIANPGFESGAVSWSQTAGVIGQNAPSEPAHAGTWDAWLNGYGTSHTDTLSQSVTIPAGCTSSTLSFWLHTNTSETTTTTAYDKLTVKIGATTLATYSNLNKNTGYAQKSFSVGSFAGQTVTISFSGVEDSSLQTSFVVDDTALNAS